MTPSKQPWGSCLGIIRCARVGRCPRRGTVVSLAPVHLRVTILFACRVGLLVLRCVGTNILPPLVLMLFSVFEHDANHVELDCVLWRPGATLQCHMRCFLFPAEADRLATHLPLASCCCTRFPLEAVALREHGLVLLETKLIRVFISQVRVRIIPYVVPSPFMT